MVPGGRATDANPHTMHIGAGDETLTRLAVIGRQLKMVNQQRAVVVKTARNAAIEAVAEGISEVEVARTLGVDRARTLRRWLGK